MCSFVKTLINNIAPNSFNIINSFQTYLNWTYVSLWSEIISALNITLKILFGILYKVFSNHIDF